MNTATVTLRHDIRAFGVALAIVLSIAGLSGCEGGGKDRGGDSITVDIRPLVEQMGGGSGSSAQSTSVHGIGNNGLHGTASQPITGPGNSVATTDVLSVIIGAIAIGFQDTPLGPNTAITDDLKDSLKTAAINSIKFISWIQLPANNPFVEFDIPPPGAIHWQIVVVGTRDVIHYLTDLKDDSPIYYGFNTDAAGNPTFLTTTTATAAPIDLTMKRACVVSSPPNGCAQYKDRSTPVITTGVEITHVYGILANGSLSSDLLTGTLIARTTGGGTGTCGNPTGCDAATAAAAMPAAAALATYSGVRVDTTHQRSPAESAACMGTSTDTTADTGSLGNCEVSSYTTMF